MTAATTAAAAILACGALTATTTAQMPDLTREELPTRSGDPIVAESGRLGVPENRSDPDSRTISLAFLRVPSPLDEPGPPVFMLAGGPGGSSIDMVRQVVGGGGRMVLEALGGDLVAIDQRGVGRSRPSLETDTRCDLPLDQPGEPQRLLEQLRACYRAEARRWREQGVDLTGYTTVESADDIDAVRRALGYEKIVLWGQSYGSHLALATLRRHEDHVARAVLIGPEGPDHTIKLPGSVQATLERVAELARQDPAIAQQMPDLLATLREVLERLERQPQFVELDGQRIGISRFDVQWLLSNMLGRTRGGIDRFPATVHAMASGDFTEVARELREVGTSGIGSAMQMVMDSASGLTRERAARIAEQAPRCLLGDAIDFPFPHVAEAWGAPDLGDDYRGPLRSDVPVLFIVGDLDPRAPVSNARELMESLPGAHLVVVTNVAHDLPWAVPDIRRAWTAFLAGGDPAVTRVEGPPVRFQSLP